MNIKVNPQLQQALDELKNALTKRETIIIVADCIVDYEGRSRSTLSQGERIIIIKQDGSVLVHRPTGYKPVNWQPETTTINAYHDSDEIILKAVRSKPRETLVIHISNVKFLYTDHLVDQGVFQMYLSEHEIRDIIFQHPEIVEEELKLTEKEKPVGNGYIDLYGYSQDGRPVIIELKRITAGREAVLQLYSYVKEIHSKTGIKPRGIIVAPKITQNAVRLLRSLGLEWREISIQRIWEKYYSREKRQLTLEKFTG